MAIIVDPHSLDYQPMSALLIKTLLAALSVLVAFQIRDCVVQGIALFVPADATKKFIFTAMITLFFLFATVLIAWSCQNLID